MIYDLIVIGSGAAGIMAAITAAEDKKSVLILEKLPLIASKLKATGGGRCNLTNTLGDDEFMGRFGRDGRFMQDALREFNHKDLCDFFSTIGVDTHAPDGFRIFPTSHSSKTIIDALEAKMMKMGIEIKCNQRVLELLTENSTIKGVKTEEEASYYSKNVIVATGGMGYPTLGGDGDGFELSKKLGHKVTDIHPAMLPLHTKERWVESCRAHTIPKAKIKVDMKKHKKLHACGDLIFTTKGIRGPVVLDFAREITPLLEKYGEVPIVVNMTNGMDEDKVLSHLKNQSTTILNALNTLLPAPISLEFCNILDIDPQTTLSKIDGEKKSKLINIVAWTPLTIVGHDGFKNAMITRGGISLKEIDPKTMKSKIINGLYFCGEVVNIDGPCGGYNLQWAFSSGYLAGKLN